MPIFLSSHNPAYPPTLSTSFHNNLIKPSFKNIIQPSFQNNLSTQSFQNFIQQNFHNNLIKPSFKNFIQQKFHNNLSTQSFQPSFQNSLNNNHNTNHFEDDTELNNLQKDFQQVTYITKNHHPTKRGQGPPHRIYQNISHKTLGRFPWIYYFPEKVDFPRNLHKVLCKCFFKRVLQKISFETWWKK